MRYNPFHHPAIPNLKTERNRDREREIVVNMDYMSMLEFGQFFIFIFNLPVFPFFLVLPFVSSLIIASNTLPDWTGLDRMGARVTGLTLGIYLVIRYLFQGRYLR